MRYEQRIGVVLTGSALLAIITIGFHFGRQATRRGEVALGRELAINHELHPHSTSPLSRRWEYCDWDNIEANSQEEEDKLGYCEKKFIEGSHMICMLNDASQHQNPTTGQAEYGWASEWTDPAVLDVLQVPPYDSPWGWTTNTEYRPRRAADLGFEKAFSQLRINPDQETWTHLEQRHEEDVWRDGIDYQRTGGFYINQISDSFNAIIALNNYGPVAMNNRRSSDNKLPPEQITKLRQWSDLVYLGAVHELEDRGETASYLRNIRHIFQHHIVNPETIKIMNMAWEIDSAAELEEWPGFHFTPSDPEFPVLLASPNARGVAWFLGQHKETMGVKVIRQIIGFRCKDRYQLNLYCLYFDIVPGPMPPPARALRRQLSP